MSIGTYDELQTAVANWLARSNLSARIPEFIALCEATVRRRLAVGDMEKRATATTVADEAYVALPSDFKRARSFALDSTPDVPLQFMTPHQMDTAFADGVTGKPRSFSIVGSEFRLGPVPDAAYTLTLIYYRTIPSLSDDATTNWLLTDHPDVYLYGSLIHAEPYLRNDARMAMWNSLYERGIGDLKTADREDRWNSGPLTVRPDPRYVV